MRMSASATWHRSIRIACSAVIFPPPCLDALPRAYRGITFLRDPLQRSLSNLRFASRVRGVPLAARGKSPPDVFPRMKTSGFRGSCAAGKRIPAIQQAVYPQPA